LDLAVPFCLCFLDNLKLVSIVGSIAAIKMTNLLIFSQNNKKQIPNLKGQSIFQAETYRKDIIISVLQTQQCN